MGELLGVLDWFRSKFSGEPQIPRFEELKEMPVMNENWIYFRYIVPISESAYQQMSEEENPSQKVVLEWFRRRVPTLLPAVRGIELRSPMFSLMADRPVMTMKFIDEKEEDYDPNRSYWENVSVEDRRKYGFSPIDILRYRKNLRRVEAQLKAGLRLRQYSKELTKLGFGEGDEPIIRKTNGIYHQTYPFEKRVELHLADPDVEKQVFGSSLQDQLNWIFGKEDEDDQMKKYCSKVREILEERGIRY